MPEPAWLELSFNISYGQLALLIAVNKHQEQENKSFSSGQAELLSPAQCPSQKVIGTSLT